jgi:hypothetical protein
MITVLVVIDCLRRRRRIVGIEGMSHLLVRAAGRYGPIPGIRSGSARGCEPRDRNQHRYRCGEGESFRRHGFVSLAVSLPPFPGGAHRGIGMQA